MTELNQETVTQDLEDTTVPEVTTRVIEVDNPTTEEMKGISENIQVNFDFDVIVKPVNFNFKKSKDKETNIVTERGSVQLAIPYPSVEGIVSILEKGGKGLELLLEAMETVVNTEARNLLYEDVTFNAATFPVEKVSWEFIANIPKAARRGSGIPKEVWEDFAQDYMEVMPEVTGKKIEAVANMVKILKNKLSNVRTSEEVLLFVVEQLAIYIENTPNAEEYQDCVAFLLNKAETFLNVTPEELLAAL